MSAAFDSQADAGARRPAASAHNARDQRHGRERASSVANGPFFTGEYPLTVDDKGRLLVPAEVRKELEAKGDGTTLMMVVGQNGKYWLYPENYYRQRVAPTNDAAVFAPDELNYMMLTFSGARRMTPDKQGRMVLPDDEDFDRESLGREVMLIGLNSHLQLWNREEWRQYKAQLRPRQAELAERFRQVQERKADRIAGR